MSSPDSKKCNACEINETSKSSEKQVQQESNLTVSTKFSQQPLIYKTKKKISKDYNKFLKQNLKCCKNLDISLSHLGIFHIIFGLLMSIFGILVIIYGAELSQIGSGLWGSFFAIASGTTGLLAISNTRCPLKENAKKLFYTLFLAFSLISIAASQLVLVISFIGLARDLNKQKLMEDVQMELGQNSMVLFSSAALITVSGFECLCAIITSYKCARLICPCFENQPDLVESQIVTTKDILLRSWLGNQNYPPVTPPLYVMTAPNTRERRKKPSTLSMPLVAQLPPKMNGYPLIPAPLGPIPSPTLWAHPTRTSLYSHKRRRSKEQQLPKQIVQKRKKSKQKSKKKQITTEELIRSYTGLDRIIAEEFIEICDSQINLINNSCQSSPTSTNGVNQVPPNEQNS